MQTNQKCHFSIPHYCTIFGSDSYNYVLLKFAWIFNKKLEIDREKEN